MSQITVYDIAKEAKVSVATVSRVLNGTAPVKDTTKAKILKIIQKYQFQPNAAARSLIRKETGIIGVVLPDITNPFFPEVFNGAEGEARRLGYTFFLCNSFGDYKKESEYLNLMLEKRVDGILFLGGRINLKSCDPHLVEEMVSASRKIPIVLINGNLKDAGLARVITDEYAGAVMAARHLIELGHTDIGFIGGEKHLSTTSQKISAFRKSLRDAGLKVREEWILPDDFSVDSGRLQMLKLLEGKERPTAVCCVNDFTAIGAMKSAIEHGLRIPQDISIIGFDDIPLAHHMIPELSTISQQSSLLGETAMRTLRQMISKEKTKKLTSLQPELIVRSSTGPRL